MKHRHDDTIDKTLSALARAQPPQGMEARIQQRLQYRAVEPHDAQRWSWRPDRAWWFGMLTGATLAGLLCTVILIETWGARHRPAEQPANTAAAPASKPISKRIQPVSSGGTETAPCAHLAVRRIQRRESRAKQLIEPQRPVQERALTREEQQLVRLVHVARPAELTDLSFEARAQIAQQESTAFQKFFTPPPPPPQDTGVTE